MAQRWELRQKSELLGTLELRSLARKYRYFPIDPAMVYKFESELRFVCEFTPTEAFPSVKPIFEKINRLLSEDMDEYETLQLAEKYGDIQDEIFALDIHVIPVDTESGVDAGSQLRSKKGKDRAGKDYSVWFPRPDEAILLCSSNVVKRKRKG